MALVHKVGVALINYSMKLDSEPSGKSIQVRGFQRVTQGERSSACHPPCASLHILSGNFTFTFPGGSSTLNRVPTP